MSPRDLFELTAQITSILEQLGVPYMVGGSLASSTFGTPRLTQDIDIVADFPASKAAEFSAMLDPDFYCDTDAMMDAVKQKRCFNILHPKTGWKFDVFMVKDSVFSRGAFARRKRRELAGSGFNFWVCSAEDVVLEKLIWFKSGGQTSDRQWGDVIGVLKLSGPKLSREYMEHWAPTLQVSDLLQKAMQEAGLTTK